MSDKLIAIFGYNSKSFELITQLNIHKNKFTILDHDPLKIQQALNNGLTAKKMDYRRDDDLTSLGIGTHIDTLFCYLEHDSENVFLVLSARALDKKLKIISIVNQPESAEKLIAAGANKIIDPYEICSHKTHQLLTKPDISWLLDDTIFSHADLNMSEITIPEKSILENTFTSELNLNERYNLFLVGVVDKELGEKLYFSLGEQDHKLDAGDILVILGAQQDIKKFKKEIGVTH